MTAAGSWRRAGATYVLIAMSFFGGDLTAARAEEPVAPVLECATSRGEMPWHHYLSFVESRPSFGDDGWMLDPLAPVIEAFRTPDVEVVLARDVMLSRVFATLTVRAAGGAATSARFLERGEPRTPTDAQAGRVARVIGAVDDEPVVLLCAGYTTRASCVYARVVPDVAPVPLEGATLAHAGDAIVFRTSRGFALVGLGRDDAERTVDEIDLVSGTYNRRVMSGAGASLVATLREDRITLEPETPPSRRACGAHVGEVRARVRMGVVLDGEARIHADDVTITRVTPLDARGGCETRYEAESNGSYWYAIGLRAPLDGTGQLRTRFGVAEVRCEARP